MAIDIKYLDKFIKVTEKAAYGASKFIGKNDKLGADKGAVDSMRNELNKIDVDGRVVIGEGEMDEAPMLFVGEKVGNKKGQSLDIAVDPLEGTNFVAKNLPNAFSVMAIAEKNNLFSAPDTYMEKIAIGPGLPKNLLDLDNTVEENINLLAKAKNKSPDQLTACLLKRERHNKIIESLNKMNVKIKFIEDGDISGIIYVVDENSPVDLYLGVGGSPEGILAAAALSCLGGQIQGRLILDHEQKIKATKMGIKNFDRKYNIDEMIRGDVMFFATGITNGDLISGIKDINDSFEVSTFVLHLESKTNKIVKNIYKK